MNLIILIGEIIFDIITKINNYIESSENIFLFRSIISLYEKFMASTSINQNNFQKFLEKIFAHVEYIIQKILIGISTIDVAIELEKFLIW